MLPKIAKHDLYVGKTKLIYVPYMIHKGVCTTTTYGPTKKTKKELEVGTLVGA